MEYLYVIIILLLSPFILSIFEANEYGPKKSGSFLEEFRVEQKRLEEANKKADKGLGYESHTKNSGYYQKIISTDELKEN